MPYGRYRRNRRGYRRNRRRPTRYRRRPTGYYRRRRYRRNARTRVVAQKARGPWGITDNLYVKLKYKELIGVSSATVWNLYQFRGNGAYDPLVALGGGRPQGWDQWSQFYKKYRCRGSAIKIKAISDGGNTQTMGIAVWPVLPSDTAPLNNNEILETAYVRNTYVGLQTGKGIAYVKNYMSSKKQFGVKNINDELNYVANMNALPASEWYWNIGAWNVSADDQLQGAYLEVTIWYYITLEQRIQIENQ